MNKDRIEFLKQKERDIRAALADEMIKRAKREKRETEKLQSLIGEAVVKAAAASAEFRLMICQTALAAHISDEKTRRFLASKGWGQIDDRHILDSAETTLTSPKR